MTRALTILIFAILLGCKPTPKPAERIIDTTAIRLNAEERQFIKDHPVVTWALDANRPPIIFVDKHQTVHGRVPVYLAIITKKTGLHFKPVPVGSLSDGLEAVKNGYIDIVTSVQPSNVSNRNDYMSFSAPFANYQGVFLLRYNDRANSPLTVGLQRDDSAKEYLMESFPGIRIIEVDEHEEAITLLARGSVDLVVLNESTADFFMPKFGTRLHKANTNFKYHTGFGYKKENVILGSILSKAIKSISQADKDYINEAWRSEDDNRY